MVAIHARSGGFLSIERFQCQRPYFDEYKTKSKASVEAEMRIADHMALSADNKIAPEILEQAELRGIFGLVQKRPIKSALTDSMTTKRSNGKKYMVPLTTIF